MWSLPLNTIYPTRWAANALVALAVLVAWPVYAQDDADLHRAYQFQTRAIQLQLAGRQPLGFKAGLTSAQSQQRFAADGPVAGVLPANAELPPGVTIRRQDFLKPMLEVELAFRLAEPVDRPLSGIAELRDKVAGFGLAIELPDLGLVAPVDGGNPGVSALVRSNVAARHVLLGNTLRFADQSPDQLSLTLMLNGQLRLQTVSSALPGGQWQALLFLVNRTVASGWRIEPEQWLITGALGGMLPLEDGEYRLLSELEDISFRVVP